MDGPWSLQHHQHGPFAPLLKRSDSWSAAGGDVPGNRPRGTLQATLSPAHLGPPSDVPWGGALADAVVPPELQDTACSASASAATDSDDDSDDHGDCLDPERLQVSPAQLAEVGEYWRAENLQQEFPVHPWRRMGFSQAVQAEPGLLAQHEARRPQLLVLEALVSQPDADDAIIDQHFEEVQNTKYTAMWVMARQMSGKPLPPQISLSALVQGPWLGQLFMPAGGGFNRSGRIPSTSTAHWLVLLKERWVLLMMQQIGAATAPGINQQEKAFAMRMAHYHYCMALYYNATIQLCLGRDPWAQPSAAAAGQQEVQGSPGAPSDGSSATRRAASNSVAVMQGSAALTGHAGDTAVEASPLLPAPTGAEQQGKRSREHAGVQADEGAAVDVEGSADDEEREVGRTLKRSRQAASDKVDRAASSLLPSLLLQQQQDGQPHQGQGEGCASPGQGRTVPGGASWARAEKRTAAEEGDARPVKRRKSGTAPRRSAV